MTVTITSILHEHNSLPCHTIQTVLLQFLFKAGLLYFIPCCISFMMILSSWFWIQYFLGVFPFRLFSKSPNIQSTKFSYYGVALLILNIICEIAEFKFVVGVYTEPGTEPQILSCLYNSIGIIYIILLRLFKVKKTILLYDVVLKEMKGGQHLLNHLWFLIVQLFCSILTTIILYRRIMLINVFIFVVMSTKTLICLLSPLFIEEQYSLICSVLQQSMHKINTSIQSNDLNKANLCYFKSKHSKLVSLFQETTRFYSFDLFYTISSGGLRILIIMNDLIFLSFLKHPSHYNISMVFFSFLLIFLVLRIWWVCFRSVSFMQEVSMLYLIYYFYV